MSKNLAQILGRWTGKPRILVLGDAMLDRYTSGIINRASPEAAALVLTPNQREMRLGGAANCASLCKSLGAEVLLMTVIGGDLEGQSLLQVMCEQGLSTQLVIVDEDRGTTMKERFLGGPQHQSAQQVLRVDWENVRELCQASEKQLLSLLQALTTSVDVVLVSDYGKGVCTTNVLRAVFDWAERNGIKVLVDPAKDSKPSRYEGAFLVKPNRRQASFMADCRITSRADAVSAAMTISRKNDFQQVLITLDGDGMLLFDTSKSPVFFEPHTREVTDVTGAGDTVLAAIGVAMAQGESLADACEVASYAASLQVQRMGAVAISLPELRQSIHASAHESKRVDVTQLRSCTDAYRRCGKTIVFTNGCFDVIHVGHLRYLEQAARLGDVLIVGMNSDNGVRRLKGCNRPIIDQESRAGMLAGLACVDHVVIFDDDTPHALLNASRPDVLVKGGTYELSEVIGREIVESYGGRVLVLDKIDGISTTEIVGRIARMHPR